jgi:hypothetical protein
MEAPGPETIAESKMEQMVERRLVKFFAFVLAWILVSVLLLPRLLTVLGTRNYFILNIGLWILFAVIIVIGLWRRRPL